MTNKLNIKIPKTFMGLPVEGAMERILEKERSQSQEQPDDSKNQPFQVNNPNIVSHDYIQIPQLKRLISTYELKDYNNMNWQDTHFKLQETGLLMPTIPEFMTHFINVVKSYQSKGKISLFDLAGNSLTKEEVEDIYFHLTKDHIAVYGNQKGAWTWLDAKFVDDNGMKVHSEHRTFKDNQGNKTLKPNKVEALERCVLKECFIDFHSLNSQGLPKFELNDKYEQGENIYFWQPENGRVAWFNAYSDRASLNCNLNSSIRSSDLGVFAVSSAGDKARQNAGGVK